MTRTPVTLATGQRLVGRSIGPVSQTDIIRFAGAGGDFNPLHHDADHARRAGLPGVIAMGQMQAGMLAAWIADALHVEHLLSYSVRFVSPLAIGEILELTGTVDQIEQGVATVVLRASVDDRVVVHGRATARVMVPH